MRTHSFIALAALVLTAGAAPGQQTLSFDSPTSPGPLPGAVNPEGWSSDGGTVTVVPHGPLSGPAGGFPAHGDQWCILNPGTTGGLAVPAGGPAPYPFAPGQTANVRVPLPIPPSSGQPVTLRFDWTYVSRESPNASSYNDFFTVDLTDGSGTVLQNLLYRDTHSTTLVSPPAVPPETGTLPGSGSEEDPPGAPKTAVVTVDPGLHGNAGVWLELHVGNAGDSAVDSYAYVDHVRLEAPALYPGTGQDLVLETGVDAPPDTVDRKRVLAGTTTTFQVTSPAQTFDGAPLILLLQAFPTGAFPGGTPSVPGAQIDLTQQVFALTGLPGSLLGAATLPPGGFTVSLPNVSGIHGLSFIAQGAVLSPASPTGYATTDGHELVYPKRVFVSATTGSSTNPGTSAAPLGTIGDGYALAKTYFHGEVVVATGAYSESPVFDAPVSVRGGFDPLTWTKTPGARSTLLVGNQATRVKNVQGNAVLSSLEFQAANAPQPPAGGPFDMGMASVAADVRNCGSGLRFEDCVFQAGRGADGVAGASVTAPGSDGSAGSGGGNGFVTLVAYTGASGGSGGSGARSGGGGGRGGDIVCVPGIFGGCTTADATAGHSGGSGGGCSGNGGGGGSAAVCGTAGSGAGGNPGADGSPGANGTPPASPNGAVDPALGDWLPGVAADGQDGGAGCGGGGGGGGGGVECAEISFATGGGGGGGGGGAGGGSGGQGGVGGGASFAVYLFNASPTFVTCTFVAGQGGAGGAGGNGSGGGSGGAGGAGGSGLNLQIAGLGNQSGAGGNGGAGGDGGGGGAGGGAHGGPSWCVFKAGASFPVGLTGAGHSFQQGVGGSGGVGGQQGGTGTLAPGGQPGPSGIIGS